MKRFIANLHAKLISHEIDQKAEKPLALKWLETKMSMEFTDLTPPKMKQGIGTVKGK